MSAFQFRLSRLQHVRALEEHIAREIFLAADRVARDAESAADHARQAIVHAEGELRSAQARPRIDVHELFAHQRHLDLCRAQRNVALARARSMRAQAETSRQSWSERRKELRGLERLEERDRTAWQQEELVRETRTLDEVALMRSQRNKRTRHSVTESMPASMPMQPDVFAQDDS